jgi:hypothetical protein
MEAASQQALIIIGVLAVVPILLGIRRRREAIFYTVRGLVIIEGIYLGVACLMVRSGQPPLTSILAGMVPALLVSNRMSPRKRYTPARVKRIAKAKFELETGVKFNPKKHEFDHEIPFSRGGSNTRDNIRVVEKRLNRSKGNRTPWWDLLGKLQ